MTREIKWSQWGKSGLLRCGFKDYNTLMKWMADIGKDAARCIRQNEADHAVYGRKIYNEDGNLDEVRFYCNTYMTDEDLEMVVAHNPHDTFYVAHRKGGSK